MQIDRKGDAEGTEPSEADRGVCVWEVCAWGGDSGGAGLLSLKTTPQR